MAYVKYARESKAQSPKSKVWYGAALVLFALGLMCKPMLVTWPFVMLLLDYWPLQRVPRIKGDVSGQLHLTPGTPHPAKSFRHLVIEKLPFLAFAAVSCVITILAQDKWRSLANADQVPLEYRVINALVGYAANLGKMLLPVDLAVFYPFPADVPWEPALFCGLLLAAVTAFVLWRSKIWPFLPVGWFWYLGTLVPVIGVVQVGGQAMADRYTYIPSIGFFVVLVWLGAELAGPKVWRRTAAGMLAVMALAICLPFSSRQISTWKNTRTLFEHAHQVTSDNFIALNILGEVLWHEGRTAEAIQHYREAVQAGPSYPYAWCGLGMALYANGQKEEGIACQRQALKLNPENPQALVNLGLLLLWEGQPAEAEQVLRRAVEARPGFAEAHADLALALEALDREVEALDHFVAAVKFKPEAVAFRLHLAAALLKLKRVDEALVEYQTALELKPDDIEIRLAVGRLLSESGRAAEATAEFRRAVEQSPTNVLALDGLGYALAQAGQIGEALNYFRQALELSPTNAFVRLHLGMMLQRTGSAAEAVAEYRLAIEYNPHLIAALNNLAWMLATHPDATVRDGAEAIVLAKQACELTEHREPLFIGTLAAAHAEEGHFTEAISAAERARNLAREIGSEEIERRNAELLELYRAGKPFRESE
jgi:Flp pilus assembly protein TadD